MQLIQQIHPDWNMNVWTERNTFAKSMGSQQAASYGGQLKSAGTIVKHLGDAFTYLPIMESGPLGPSDTASWLNPAKSAIRGQMGDPKYLDALGHYNTAVHGLAGETAYLLANGVPTEHEILAWKDKFDITKHSPSEVRGALDEAQHLMMGRVSNVAQAKDRAFGGSNAPPTDPISLFGPQEQSIMKQISAGTFTGRQNAAPQASPQGGAPAPSGTPGIIRYDAQGNRVQ
jgi:hypothetical protein